MAQIRGTKERKKQDSDFGGELGERFFVVLLFLKGISLKAE